MRLVRILGIVGLGFISALCRVAALPFLVVGSTADTLRFVLMSRNALAKFDRVSGGLPGGITSDAAFDELCERRQRQSQRPRR